MIPELHPGDWVRIPARSLRGVYPVVRVYRKFGTTCVDVACGTGYTQRYAARQCERVEQEQS